MIWHKSAHGKVDGSPAVVNGNVYVGNDQGTIYAFAVKGGTITWHHHIGGTITGTPLVYRDVVYIGNAVNDNTGDIYELNASSGYPVASPLATGGEVNSSPVEADGLIYVASNNNEVLALSPAPDPARAGN